MMQQPVMTEDALELQGQQQVAPFAPWQCPPFPAQAMQQRSPLGPYLLAGAVVIIHLAGLYLLNKSYKVNIQKRPDKIDEL